MRFRLGIALLHRVSGLRKACRDGPSFRSWPRATSAVAACLALGCGLHSVVETAYHGDLPSLRRAIAEAESKGELDRDRAQELAVAVARREVRAATGRDALHRIQAARGCVQPVSEELREQAARGGEAGAEATMVLLESGLAQGEELFSRHKDSRDGAFRALAARGAVSRRFGPARRRFMVDVDQRVRRAAFRAAREALDVEDLPVVLESSRVDPDPVARSLAIRAAGRIGGSRTVQALRDLWPGADEQDRLAIAEAWAEPRSAKEGGLSQLRRVAESEAGLPSVAAAALIARAGGDDRKLGQAALMRALSDGTADERDLAIQRLELDAPAVDGLRRVMKSGESRLGVLAASRLLEVPAARADAVKFLYEESHGKGEGARAARVALAVRGDERVAPLFLRDLSSKIAADRRVAALSLFTLERYGPAARALADADGGVRMSVACQMATSGR